MQWLPVLRSLAAELADDVPAEKLRLMFFNVGGRLAGDVESRFESVQTLTELENEINEFWLQLNWGWIHFTEQAGCIHINHQAAPLAEAFGDEALPWSVGLLEGFYQALFKILGAGDGMTVRAVEGECADMQILLRFGNHVA
ncbi:hypothetical protein [Rhodoferax sp.]|uniref:cellulose biosynthesis protein BcsD n=1 Tax=Rhodoferax sp. TaxID=50421 RepID=UPI0026374764|nr:hypothetical protein [Rhodoferax sp.]MDD2923748.1 hypothetical protein [Rhodoferax sp.]